LHLEGAGIERQARDLASHRTDDTSGYLKVLRSGKEAGGVDASMMVEEFRLDATLIRPGLLGSEHDRVLRRRRGAVPSARLEAVGCGGEKHDVAVDLVIHRDAGGNLLDALLGRNAECLHLRRRESKSGELCRG